MTPFLSGCLVKLLLVIVDIFFNRFIIWLEDNLQHLKKKLVDWLRGGAAPAPAPGGGAPPPPAGPAPAAPAAPPAAPPRRRGWLGCALLAGCLILPVVLCVWTIFLGGGGWFAFRGISDRLNPPTPTPTPTELLTQWGYSVTLGPGCQASYEEPLGGVWVRPATGRCVLTPHQGSKEFLVTIRGVRQVAKRDGQPVEVESALFEGPPP